MDPTDQPPKKGFLDFLKRSWGSQSLIKKILILILTFSLLSTLGIFVSLAITKVSSRQAGIFKKQEVKAGQILTRGIAGDLIADVVIGQRDFTEIGIYEINNRSLSQPGGVVIDHGLKKAYIWDAGNNRIVSVDMNSCNAAASNGCVADKVFGQATLFDQGACNRDASFQTYPDRPPSSASTLCGIREDTLTTLEDKSWSSMYVDETTHDLYVPDVKNNRVLLYRNPYGAQTGGAGDTIADDFWGQDNFSGNLCNKGGTPTNSSLCFQSETGDGNGVAISPDRNYLWISDGGNLRVLRFPRSGNSFGKTADLVLGQPNFTSNSRWTGDPDYQHFYSPTTIRFGTNGKMYIADFKLEQFGRVFEYATPPTTNNQVAGGGIGNIMTGNALTIEVDPTISGVNQSRGIWLFDHGGYSIQNNPRTQIQLWGYNHELKETIIGPYAPQGSLNPDNGYPEVQLGSGAFAIDYLASDNNRPSVYIATYLGNININRYNKLDNGYWKHDRSFFLNGNNTVTARRLYHPAWAGVSVSNNQLAVTDGRLLVWNNLSSLISNNANGASPNYVLGTNNFLNYEIYPSYNDVKAGGNKLWASRFSAIEIYNLPITQSNQAPIKTIGSITGPSTINVLGGGTIPIDGEQHFISTVLPTPDGYLWVSQTSDNRVLRIRNPLTNPEVDVIIGQANASDRGCNRFGGAAPNTLCYPGGLGLDIHGNLYISDHFIEVAGNHRLLMYAASNFTGVTSLKTNVSATKVFPAGATHMTFGMAFDSDNHMVVGVNPYSGRRFVDYYLDPTNPNSTSPDGQLKDYTGWAISSTFDTQNNLYVYDANRGQVRIYKSSNGRSLFSAATPTPTPTPTPPPPPADFPPSTFSIINPYTTCPIGNGPFIPAAYIPANDLPENTLYEVYRCDTPGCLPGPDQSQLAGSATPFRLQGDSGPLVAFIYTGNNTIGYPTPGKTYRFRYRPRLNYGTSASTPGEFSSIIEFSLPNCIAQSTSCSILGLAGGPGPFIPAGTGVDSQRMTEVGFGTTTGGALTSMTITSSNTQALSIGPRVDQTGVCLITSPGGCVRYYYQAPAAGSGKIEISGYVNQTLACRYTKDFLVFGQYVPVPTIAPNTGRLNISSTCQESVPCTANPGSLCPVARLEISGGNEFAGKTVTTWFSGGTTTSYSPLWTNNWTGSFPSPAYPDLIPNTNYTLTAYVIENDLYNTVIYRQTKTVSCPGQASQPGSSPSFVQATCNDATPVCHSTGSYSTTTNSCNYPLLQDGTACEPPLEPNATGRCQNGYCLIVAAPTITLTPIPTSISTPTPTATRTPTPTPTPTPLPTGSTRLKNITFENGSLTNPNSGADQIVGTVTLESATPLKGSFSAKINRGGSYLKENFTATNDIYISFYIKLNASLTADVRIAQFSSGSAITGNLLLRSNRRLLLRQGTATIGSESPVLSVGVLYRIGLRQKKGTSNNGILEAYLATGDAAFTTPFARTTTGTWTTQNTSFNLGATANNPINALFDNLRLDTAVMP